MDHLEPFFISHLYICAVGFECLRSHWHWHWRVPVFNVSFLYPFSNSTPSNLQHNNNDKTLTLKFQKRQRVKI